jgi:hypothetical protein
LITSPFNILEASTIEGTEPIIYGSPDTVFETAEFPVLYEAFNETEYSMGEERPLTIIGEVVELASTQVPFTPPSE